MANAVPSQDPADKDSLQGTLNTVLNKFLMDIDDMLPAIVVSYDRATNRAVVQPLIRMKTTTGENQSRAPTAPLPVFQYGGGGFVLSFPVKAGDLGWIKANDRDITAFLGNYGDSPINTLRKHSFNDAMFFPDAMRNIVINAEDGENAVLQNLEGTVRVAIWADKVKVTAPEVIIDTPQATVTGNLLVNGSISAGAGGAGNVMINGSLTATGQVTASGIPLSTHKHTGVQTGGGTSGSPTV